MQFYNGIGVKTEPFQQVYFVKLKIEVETGGGCGYSWSQEISLKMSDNKMEFCCRMFRGNIDLHY